VSLSRSTPERQSPKSKASLHPAEFTELLGWERIGAVELQSLRSWVLKFLEVKDSF
jgi:hypothetical protein